jgi:hypothetical protein
MFVFNNSVHSPAQLEKALEEMRLGSLKEIQGPPDDVGRKLKDAINHRLNPSSRIFAGVQSVRSVRSEDSFGERLKEAVRKRQEPAKKAREQESARWKRASEKARPRPATKGE